jgi:histidine phosphotransferase ChpT
MLCARLCHDLASPAGAIRLGLGLFDDAGGDDAETVRLIELSAREVTTRLSFFRLVFATDRGHTTPIWPDAERLLGEMLARRRVVLQCRGNDGSDVDPTDLPADFVRLVCCLVVIAADALPRGGAIDVTFEGTPECPSALVAVGGPMVGIREDTQSALLMADPHALSARTVDAYFARRLAHRLGACVSIAHTAESQLLMEARIGAGPAVHWLGSAAAGGGGDSGYFPAPHRPS